VYCRAVIAPKLAKFGAKFKNATRGTNDARLTATRWKT
jgi:hypothetical protein